MMSSPANNDAQKSPVLPPDGTIIRISPWRRKIAWIGVAALLFFALCITVYAVREGKPVAIFAGLGYGLGAFCIARLALSGVILSSQGVTVRSALRTYRWRWDEISLFELRDRGETPRFRIHLKDGKAKGALGFFARSPDQEEHGRALFQALEKRLELEHARRKI